MKRLFQILAVVCVLVPLLTADADAPPGRYIISAGTVLDTRTQLTWQQDVDSGIYDRADAEAYCAGLTLAGGGWRLPAVSELLTILDRTRTDPAIDPTAFPSTPAEYFWSSSANVGYGGGGWPVSFADGSSLGNNEGEWLLYRVRCVR